MLLEAHNLQKRYDGGATAVDVLTGVDFQMGEGELIGIYGASGSGKSTLLHILGGLDQPTDGVVEFEGKHLKKMSESELAHFRNQSIGFVFQFYHLLPEFSALENVMIPCLIGGMRKKEATRKALKAIEEVALTHRASHRPSEMSGGEQQRVALARAAVMQPKLILADEPTGNLDRQTGERVFDYLLELNRSDGIAMLIVSHNQELLNQLPRKLLLRDGKLHDLKNN
jgi:lipoprotein-releasing system ATP-binding protein